MSSCALFLISLSLHLHLPLLPSPIFSSPLSLSFPFHCIALYLFGHDFTFPYSFLTLHLVSYLLSVFLMSLCLSHHPIQAFSPLSFSHLSSVSFLLSLCLRFTSSYLFSSSVSLVLPIHFPFFPSFTFLLFLFSRSFSFYVLFPSHSRLVLLFIFIPPLFFYLTFFSAFPSIPIFYSFYLFSQTPPLSVPPLSRNLTSSSLVPMSSLRSSHSISLPLPVFRSFYLSINVVFFDTAS